MTIPNPDIAARNARILEMTRDGKTAREIAEVLGIAPQKVFDVRSEAKALARATRTTVALDKIQVGRRQRQDLGDIDALAASIGALGLLQPLVVTPDHRLIAGQRRLEAVRRLGWTEVDVRVVELTDALLALRAERDENTCRKEFTPSEAVAIGKAIEELERPKAKERQKEHGKTAPGKPKNTGGNFPPVNEAKGKTRDKVAEAVGMSGRTYEKAKRVVEAAEEDPERHAETVQEMDRTGKVDAAYKKVKGQRTRKETRRPAPPEPLPSLPECLESLRAARTRLDQLLAGPPAYGPEGALDVLEAIQQEHEALSALHEERWGQLVGVPIEAQA